MKDSQIVRCREKPRKTTSQTTKKDLYLNSLLLDMIYSRTSWRSLIHVTDPI